MRTHTRQGFSNRVDWWGENMGKMGKTAWKLQNRGFYVKKVRGTWRRQANFSGSWGDPPSCLPTRGNPASTGEKNTQITLKQHFNQK